MFGFFYKKKKKTLFFFFIQLYQNSPHSLKMSLPDFMTDPNAVLNDKDHDWRYNRIPDYNKVNAIFEEGKYH